MRWQRRFGILGAVLAAALGCGGGGEGPSGNPSATLATCDAYCDALLAETCASPKYASIDDCKTSECGNVFGASTPCQVSLKAFYDCRTNQKDICADDGCATQMAAIAGCV